MSPKTFSYLQFQFCQKPPVLHRSIHRKARAFSEQTKFKGEIYANPDHSSYDALEFVSAVSTIFTPKVIFTLNDDVVGWYEDYPGIHGRLQARLGAFPSEAHSGKRRLQGGIIVAGPEKWVIAMELYPGFALYRGLYKLGQYSTLGASVGGHGMKWENLSDSSNGMKEVMIIMVVDQLILSVAGLKKCSLICLPNLWKKSSPTAQKPSLQKSSSKVFVHMDKSDVSQEREKVEQLLEEGSLNASVICDNLAKVYPGRDGNPPKAAVRGLSLALPRGECFGMLGPNGA